MLVPQERRALVLLLLVFGLVAGGAALLEVLGPAPFAVPFSPDLPDGTLAVVRGPVDQVIVAGGGHLICRVGGVRVFMPASTVPDPAPVTGGIVECYGLVSTYGGVRELVLRQAGDLRRVDQE
ncbi:MAG TPA: hypothetical protein PK089_00490 [Methanoregulaceae archaeon]|nr:hypothetical protein [Methanoregulaceae archaeon]HQJ87427.1 hypothetical protein [Methanoregulaceae archaeon]